MANNEHRADSCFFDDKQLDLVANELWNKLTVSYLFSTVPLQFVDKFLEIAFNIVEKFKLQV